MNELRNAIEGESVDFDLEDLEGVMLDLPQVEWETVHTFGPNVYIRQSIIPRGTLAMGAYHKDEHITQILSGKVYMLHGDVITYVEGPAMFLSPAGKKLGYITEELVIQNIYSTSETNIDKLEEMLIEKSENWEKGPLFAGSKKLLEYVEQVELEDA